MVTRHCSRNGKAFKGGGAISDYLHVCIMAEPDLNGFERLFTGVRWMYCFVFVHECVCSSFLSLFFNLRASAEPLRLIPVLNAA